MLKTLLPNLSFKFGNVFTLKFDGSNFCFCRSVCEVVLKTSMKNLLFVETYQNELLQKKFLKTISSDLFFIVKIFVPKTSE